MGYRNLRLLRKSRLMELLERQKGGVGWGWIRMTGEVGTWARRVHVYVGAEGKG